MESDDFNTHQVLTGSDAGWHVKAPPSSSGNHSVDTPFTVGVVETLLSNLEPVQTLGAGCSSIVDLSHPVSLLLRRWTINSRYLCKVDKHRSFVRGSNGVVGVVCILSTADNMLVPGANFCTSWDLHHGR